MRVDFKVFAGMLLSLAGMLLTAYAALTAPPAYMGSPKSPILEVGLTLLAFGSIMWFFAHHANYSQKTPVDVESMHD